MNTKKFLDIILLILFLSTLAGMFLPTNLHQILGVVLIVLVLCHNILNRNFYLNLSRSNISRLKILNLISISIFALSLITLTISGLTMSGILNLIPLNWRSIHLIAAIVALICLAIHLALHARRYIKSSKTRLITFITLIISIAAIFGLPYLDRWFHKVNINAPDIIHGEKVKFSGKIITLYFSRVGNTNFPADVDAVSGASIIRDNNEIFGNAQMLALMVNDAVGGDIFEIQTVDTYPASYSETVNIAKNEFASENLPALKSFPDLSEYNVIILIYPLWWSNLPRPVESFIKHYDLHDKVLIPIVTHGGGDLGDSIQTLVQSTNAKVVLDALDVYSSDIPSERQNVADYLKKISGNP